MSVSPSRSLKLRAALIKKLKLQPIILLALAEPTKSASFNSNNNKVPLCKTAKIVLSN